MFTWEVDTEIRLGLLEPRHAPELAQLVRSNAYFLGRFLPFATEEYRDAEATEFIQRGMRQFAANMGLQAGIIREGHLVGMVGLHLVDWGNRSSGLGYWLAESENGRGIMTRACRALMDYAFESLQLHRLEIRAAENNGPSQRVAERLGFEREGVLHGVARHEDQYLNHVIFGRLNNKALR